MRVGALRRLLAELGDEVELIISDGEVYLELEGVRVRPGELPDGAIVDALIRCTVEQGWPPPDPATDPHLRPSALQKRAPEPPRL